MDLQCNGQKHVPQDDHWVAPESDLRFFCLPVVDQVVKIVNNSIQDGCQAKRHCTEHILLDEEETIPAQ